MKFSLLHIFLALVLIISSAGFATALESGEGRLTINSVPEGADVWLSGEFIGYTPVTDIVRADSSLSLRIEKHGGNYQIWKGTAYVPEGESVSYTANLYLKTETARETGIIIVSSTVEGAEVYMDNSFVGYITNGACHIDNAKLGVHSIAVKKDGYYDFTSMAEVNPKNVATTNIVANLEPVSPSAPVTTKTGKAPASPTKAAAGVLIPFFSLLGAVVLRR